MSIATMQRATFGQLRASRFPKVLGLCDSDRTKIAADANEIQQRYITDPRAPDEGWWGGWGEFRINVSRTSPEIRTPSNVARLILMDVCKQPVRIRNEFYEFLTFGIGFQPRGCNSNCQQLEAYERETVTTLAPLVAPATIRIFPGDQSDVGKTVLVQGEDSNGVQVISKDANGVAYLGERLALSIPFTDSSNIYNTITGIQKDVTGFPVTFSQVNPATFEETALSTMEPNETVAAYRKYYVNGLPARCCNTAGPVQVIAKAKFDFVPVKNDADYMLIQSIPAMIEGAYALRDGTFDDLSAQKRGDSHWAKGLGLLFGEIDHYLGKERTAINVPLFGSNRLRPSFV